MQEMPSLPSYPTDLNDLEWAVVDKILGLQSLCQASVTITLYGDNDGFGIGQTSGVLTSPFTSNQGAGEAAFTDQTLISNSYGPTRPAFAPTGSFNPFAIPAGETITQAILTLRTGSFDSGPNTLDAPNRIVLDGVTISSAFINGFSQTAGDQIETLSFVLDPSFFPLLADGSVSLNGTHISEDNLSGGFQIDFVELDITSQAVPEPSSLAVMLGSVGLLAGFRRFGRTRKA